MTSDPIEPPPGRPHEGGEPADPFPRVRPNLPMARAAMGLIRREAKEVGLQPLRRNHARFIMQPLGYVEFGVDIDLVDGKVLRYVQHAEPASKAMRYPRRRIGPAAGEFSSDAEDFTRLKGLLGSDAFRRMARETPEIGFDGASFFIEADVDGNYSWKCHWAAEERVFRELADIFCALSQGLFPQVKPATVMVAEALPRIRKYAQQRYLAPLQADMVRLVVQRLGFVEWAAEIDLGSGELMKFPGHVKTSVHQGQAKPEGLCRLKVLLDSDEFSRLPAEPLTGGDDGRLFFIELERGGAYSWKCYWEPGAPVLASAVELIEDLAREVELTSIQASQARWREYLDKSPGSNHSLLAYALEEQGKFTEAISHLKEARYYESDDGRYSSSLGRILLKQGKVAEAIRCFERAIKLMPNNPESVYYLGNALIEAGRVAEAEECLGQVLPMVPEFVERHIQTGNTLLRAGNAKDAILYYEQVLQFRPEYSQVHYNSGRALEQIGRQPEAIEHYRQALNCRPDFTSARTALERLGAPWQGGAGHRPTNDGSPGTICFSGSGHGTPKLQSVSEPKQAWWKLWSRW